MLYPRSFLGLLLAGFTLVAAPLIVALAYSAWHTEQLAEQSRSAVFSASEVARASRSLVNRIGAIERLAQQIAVIDDPELADAFTRVHLGFGQLSSELLAMPLDDGHRAALQKTVLQENMLYERLTASPRRALNRRQISRMASELAGNAYAVQSISDLVAERQVSRLRAQAEAVQLQIVLLVLFGTALALAIALALTRHISGPISQLDASIRQLGSADFSSHIEVRGPHDLRILGERLDWLRRRLTELETQKNRFLRHLSHELKTPLTAVREGAELLNDGVGGPLAPSQRQVVGIMRDNSIKLQRLIEDLLDYQRALHAAASLVRASVALDVLLREVARAHQLAIQTKAQRLELALERVSVEADAEKLRVVLDNLIGNAVKFTPAGGRISVALTASADEVSVDVIDTGPGVPDEEHEAIFNSFFRGRARAGARIEGTGLGLAIAREFAEAHGGNVRVVRREGGGAHFRLTLPRRAPQLLPAAA